MLFFRFAFFLLFNFQIIDLKCEESSSEVIFNFSSETEEGLKKEILNFGETKESKKDLEKFFENTKKIGKDISHFMRNNSVSEDFIIKFLSFSKREVCLENTEKGKNLKNTREKVLKIFNENEKLTIYNNFLNSINNSLKNNSNKNNFEDFNKGVRAILELRSSLEKDCKKIENNPKEIIDIYQKSNNTYIKILKNKILEEITQKTESFFKNNKDYVKLLEELKPLSFNLEESEYEKYFKFEKELELNFTDSFRKRSLLSGAGGFAGTYFLKGFYDNKKYSNIFEFKGIQPETELDKKKRKLNVEKLNNQKIFLSALVAVITIFSFNIDSLKEEQNEGELPLSILNIKRKKNNEEIENKEIKAIIKNLSRSFKKLKIDEEDFDGLKKNLFFLLKNSKNGQKSIEEIFLEINEKSKYEPRVFKKVLENREKFEKYMTYHNRFNVEISSLMEAVVYLNQIKNKEKKEIFHEKGENHKAKIAKDLFKSIENIENFYKNKKFEEDKWKNFKIDNIFEVINNNGFFFRSNNLPIISQELEKYCLLHSTNLSLAMAEEKIKELIKTNNKKRYFLENQIEDSSKCYKFLEKINNIFKKQFNEKDDLFFEKLDLLLKSEKINSLNKESELAIHFFGKDEAKKISSEEKEILFKFAKSMQEIKKSEMIKTVLELYYKMVKERIDQIKSKKINEEKSSDVWQETFSKFSQFIQPLSFVFSKFSDIKNWLSISTE